MSEGSRVAEQEEVVVADFMAPVMEYVYFRSQTPVRKATHFEDALAISSNPGYQPELAWNCRDYADTLLRRNGEGDRATAISLLDESLATELGMRPSMERVLSRQDILRV